MSNLFVLMPGGRRIGWPLPADVRLGEVSRLRRLAEKRGLAELADELGRQQAIPGCTMCTDCASMAEERR